MPPATALLLAVSFLIAGLASAVEGQTRDPSRVLTERIEFAGGRLVNGAPPGATYMPGDPKIERELALTVSPGDRDSLSVTVTSLQPSSSLEVYLRFGTSADSHIRIQAAAGSSTRQTLELPYEIPADICDNLERVKHKTKLYELVNVAGTRISEEQERSVVLNCEDHEPHGVIRLLIGREVADSDAVGELEKAAILGVVRAPDPDTDPDPDPDAMMRCPVRAACRQGHRGRDSLRP